MAWIQKKPQTENSTVEQLEEELPVSKKPIIKKSPQEIKERIQVVKELPVQQIRTAKDTDGTVVHFYTTEEYLTMMANEEI